MTNIKLLGTAISPEYINSWGITMGIREFLQNFLDSRSAFNCEGTCSYNAKKGLCTLQDRGPGLEVKHLVLGVSEKGENQIGQFGEGLKLALLLFAREGRKVELRSKGYRIVPVLKDSEFETQTLFFEIEEGLREVIGTKITFQCSEEELLEAKGFFPFAFKSNRRIKWIIKDRVSSPGGFLYVNGSLVAELPDALFSYHLQGERAKKLSNRDRSIVDQSEAASQIRGAIFFDLDEGTNPKLLKKWLKPILKKFKISERSIFEGRIAPPSDVDFFQSPVKETFQEVFGCDSCIQNGSSVKAIELCRRIGFKPVYIPWEWEGICSAAGIPSAESLAKESPLSDSLKFINLLPAREQENLDFAVEMVAKFYNDPATVKVVEELDSLAGIHIQSNHEGKVAGLYHKGEGIILVAFNSLKTKETALRVILHETVHQSTGEDDLTSGFQAAYDSIAAKFLLKLSESEMA